MNSPDSSLESRSPVSPQTPQVPHSQALTSSTSTPLTSTPPTETVEVNAAVDVHDLSFQWSTGKTVLDRCSPSIPQGEFWMLLGSNGCGKSTLLRLLAGLLVCDQPDRIRVTGQVGFVFQNPDHQLVMPTVGADVAFGLVEQRLSYAQVRDRVEEALNLVGLLHLIQRPIYALSGGQKQRVAIAGAIAQQCDVLLLDEPTALLDPDSQIDLVQQVQSLVRSRGITALWVTHRLDELDYCDGAILLQNGAVVDRGDPQRLKQVFTKMTP